MFTLLVVIAVLAGGYDASKCCFPRQYTATQGLMRGTAMPNGHLQILYGNINFYYDGVHQKEAFIEDLTTDGVEQRLTVIRDYHRRTKYIITANGTHCAKKSLPAFNHGCIPDSAQKLVDSHLGVRPNTTTGMGMNVYNNSAGGVTSFLITAKDDCLFVMDVSAQSTGPTPHMQVVMYYNMTVGAPPAAVFNVPTVCDSVADVVG